MFSTDDTMASSLWRAHLEYTNTSCLESKKTALSLPRPAWSVMTCSSSDNSHSDTSELPYLDTEPVETKGAEYKSLPTSGSLDSGIDSALLMAMLSGDDVAAETMVCLGHSRPMLCISPFSMGSISAPSPIDSGYGSRPDTPLIEFCGEYGLDDSAWSPVDDTSSMSDESSNTHSLEAFSDAKYWNHVTDAKTTSPAPQGPVIPRIVLSDEEGRVLEATIDDQFSVFTRSELTPAEEDADSPYGGLMSLAALENPEPASSVSPPSNLRNSASGAVLDRAFVSLIRPRPTTSAITTVYHNRHRAPTFVLDCVGEEEEEEQGDGAEECAHVEAGSAFFVLEEGDEESEADVAETLNDGMLLEDVERLTGEQPSAAQDSMYYDDAESPRPNAQPTNSPAFALVSKTPSEFNTWHFEEREDDECEECGLFLAQPDDNYHKLFDSLHQLPSDPSVVFGLLKLTTRAPTSELNTAYHVAAQGRAFRTSSVPCLYNCERGYWSSSGGLSSIVCPQDCPAHGGHGACEVDAIFHHSPPTSFSTPELNCAAPDYQALAVEVVGLPPAVRKSIEEDLDDGDLVLHSGEKFRPTANKDIPPKAGASYDDYMSRFMDDVDLSNNCSNDSLKNAPFGKLVGGALKDMTMPEAVDHLKEGLEKTESAFRAALTAPFRFNSVADRLTQHLKSGDPKSHPPRERRSSNAFRHHRKESSVSGIKTKWSNMLNKFTR